MTKQQKRKTREILRLYAEAAAGRAQMDGRAMAAALEAVEAVKREGGTRARLLQLRYLEGRSKPEVVAALYMCGTTYHKLDLEVLSTAAVVLAEHGYFLSG